MTKIEMNQNLCAVLTALDETGGDAMESTIYMAMGSDLNRWMQVESVLLTAKLVTKQHSLISLTDAGRTMAAKIAEFNKQQATAAA